MPKRILAISGSLRGASSNTAVVRALTRLAPADVEVTVYEALGEIPPFNPDLDVEPAHPAVAHFREALKGVEAMIFCSPEYAHGVSGVLKNALDWIVGSGELSRKPVAVINASPLSTFAQASLMEILKTMDAIVVAEASVELPLRGWKQGVDGIVAHAEFSQKLRGAVESMLGAIEAARTAEG